MSNRIDHAGEARRFLASAGEPGADMSAHTATSRAARAQAHATLALVEQQRIANLIALMESNHASTNDAHAALDTLSPYIAAALRLGVPGE